MKDFCDRHLGPGDEEREQMLAELGCSLEQLLEEALPPGIALTQEPDFPCPLSGAALKQQLSEWAGQNQRWRSFIGQGYYQSEMPAVIRRNVLENPAWYSSYTPYQAEISQGRLEALLVFQELICELSAMPLANASLLDEASAAAEALQLALRADKRKRRTFLVDSRCHPQTLAVLNTRAQSLGVSLEQQAVGADSDFSHYAGVLVQSPDTEGALHDISRWNEQAHACGCLVAVATDPLALTLVEPPGKQGADIVLGSSQRLGLPIGFGGPHAAFFAVQKKLQRLLPGRLIAVSHDAYGRPALRMALQTREQHIRREKATSNICTAQALLANLSAFFAVYHGAEGLVEIAAAIHGASTRLAAGLRRHGLNPVHPEFFDTLVLDLGTRADEVRARAEAVRINLRYLSGARVALSLDQCTSEADLERLQWILLGFDKPLVAPDEELTAIPSQLQRQSRFMQQPVFQRYRTETELLRYITRLERRDYSLAQGMIPLGSCTMKLNAAVTLDAIGDAGYADFHPYQPPEQLPGLLALTDELGQMLCQLTGFDRISLQPNAGAQGEYAGLLAVRRFFAAKGEMQRRYCLVPESAHGTNAASAIQAGFDLLPLPLSVSGEPDLQVLKALVEEYGDRIACMMLTYPSTHGVYEADILELTRTVHAVGAQVYLDGANFNAMIGLTDLKHLGADLAHLNLHKTFAIPHGGGGPGVGPLGVRAHLAEFLPGDPCRTTYGAVAAARFGSASVLPISWAYLRLMGYAGLKRASIQAVLSANYIASRLESAYPVLYRGAHGRVAHECIFDIRPVTLESGISAEDIAKRLLDYGFHAPTLSFPVSGTLMVEPTESESLAEIERFCRAMLAIRGEIDRVCAGEWPREDNPLVNAPHPVSALVDSWHHPYSREEAVYPLEALKQDKFWPEVGRIDQVWGDRHLCFSSLCLEGQNKPK